MTTLITLTTMAMLASAALTPLVKRLATRYHIVDRPDGHRKLHGGETPLGGGIAVFLGMCAGLLALIAIDHEVWTEHLLQNLRFAWALMGAGLVLVLVGVMDDRFNLRGRQKLLGQILAVSLLIFAGDLKIQSIKVLDFGLELGPLAIPFTYFWLLGAINALNLIDGVDGLASSVGVILSVVVAAMAMLGHHEADGIIALALAGALVGFLFYNLPPASIFLGDAGSMLIGLTVGALAIRCALKGPATVAMAAPVAVWAIPIFDVSMAILRRKLTGRSLYTTDRGHLHHCMLRHGYSGRKTLIWISLLCACTALGALCSIFLADERLALGSVAVVISLMVVTRVFGHDEFMLVVRRIQHLTLSLIPTTTDPADLVPSREFKTRLQGTNQWDELWDRLVNLAKQHDVCRMQLNVHLPALLVDYHADWSRKERFDDTLLWSTELPLFYDSRPVGRLRLAAPSPSDSTCVAISDQLLQFKEFEGELTAIFDSLKAQKQLAPAKKPARPVTPARVPVGAR